MILGTAAYMSPEQARGQVVDKRTDIWAFGCVFYEMLSGRSPFSGDTISDMIAAILGREPDWRALPDATPTNVRRVMQRALQKDSKRRLRDIGEARLALQEEPELTVAPESNRGVLWKLTAAAAAVSFQSTPRLDSGATVSSGSSCNASRASPISRSRRFESFWSARCITRRTFVGVASGRARQSGSRPRIAAIMSEIVSPLNGERPLSIS